MLSEEFPFTNSKLPNVYLPCKSDRVCSDYFVDKEPTAENPEPTQNLGYENNLKSIVHPYYIARLVK